MNMYVTTDIVLSVDKECNAHKNRTKVWFEVLPMALPTVVYVANATRLCLQSPVLNKTDSDNSAI